MFSKRINIDKLILLSSVVILATATNNPIVYAQEDLSEDVQIQTFLNEDIEDEKLATRFHKIVSKDTLYSISKEYDVSVDELKKWNALTDNTIVVGKYLGVDGVSRMREPYKSTQEFIDTILPDAIKLSEEYNIYTSIMLAQAIHETGGGNSDKSLLANNIFGIKALSDNYVWLPTWEEIDGKRVDILAKFERYDTFYDSMVSNAKKLRYGVSWDPYFYQGAWVENTASHMDVSKWLTGRYATDSSYASKLNSTIERYNLTQYDYHIDITDPIQSQRDVQFIATVKNVDSPIYSQPAGTASDNVVGTTKDYTGKDVLITEEKVNNAGAWWKISDDNIELGFVKRDAIDNVVVVRSNKLVNKEMKIINKQATVTSKPYGVEGFTFKSLPENLENVTVTEESDTRLGTFGHIYIDGTEIGWINMNALEQLYYDIISEKDMLFAGEIVNGRFGLYSQPEHAEGAELILNGNQISEAEVRGYKEATTPKGTFVYISVNGKYGWIEKSGVAIETIEKRADYTYDATISRKTDTINTLPWGVAGYTTVTSSADYYQDRVTVVQEATTPRATWALIFMDNKELGWIDKRGLSNISETVLESRVTNYMAKVTKSGHSIDSKPYGTFGYKRVSTSRDYLNKEVKVIEERKTLRSTFALIQYQGRTIGWIDKSAIAPEQILSRRNKDELAIVNRGTDTLNTLPWGVDGYKTVGHSKDYLNKTVHVLAEAVTPRATWALISLNGEELGWIDVKALVDAKDVVTSTKTVDYMAEITAGRHSIDTRPWGVEGFETIGYSKDYLGKTYKVTQEKVTGRATWVYLSGLGWMDKAGITPEAMTNVLDVNYQAKINRKGDTLNTLPWGVEGFKTVTKSDRYVGQTVYVSQEAVTPRATWAKVRVAGQQLWIDIKALEPEMMTNTTTVNYQAKVTRKGDSLNTLPWGVKGFSTVAKSDDFFGETLYVLEETTTPRATWAKVLTSGGRRLWIDSKALTPETMTNVVNVNYQAEISRKGDSLNTLPWGVKGFSTVAKSDDYLGKTFYVIQEATTPRATWAKVRISSGKELWIDIKAISPEMITSSKTVNYTAKIIRSTDTITSLPWGVKGFKVNTESVEYFNKTVRVIEEAVTARATWAKVEIDGKTLGWIDIKALKN